MARDPQLDWIVEYETLPPEDVLGSDPPTPERRWLPWWTWWAALLVISGIAFLAYLWARGGAAEPLPDPEGETSRLESIVQIEMEALQNGDRELYAQVQAQFLGRRNFDLPPDRWFAEENVGGGVELVDLETLSEDAAQATIKITWHGIQYRGVWFYKQVGDGWIHTDWPTVDLGERRELHTEHVNLFFREAEREQAEQLVAQVETIIHELCHVVDCPGGPPQVDLRLDRYLSIYHALAIRPFDYQVPSPTRMRWP